MNTQELKIDYILCSISIFFTSLITFSILKLISIVYNPYIDYQLIYNQFTTPLNLIKPEPTEKVLFLVGLVLFPIIAFCVLALCNKFIKKKLEIDFVNKLYPVFNYLNFAFALIFFIVANFSNYLFYLRFDFIFAHSLLKTLINILFLFSLTALIQDFLIKKEMKYYKILSIFASLFYASIFIVLILCNTFNLQNQINFPFLNHFDSIYYSVVQNYLGKAPLINFSNQYGLYSYFLNILFGIIGLNVIKFSFVMGLLVSLSFLFLLLVLNKTINNKFICFLAFTSILFVNYFFAEFSFYPFDFYTFMIHPLRFIIPALSIYLSYCYLTKDNKVFYYLPFVIYSFAILWNFETGVITSISWIFLLVYKELFLGIKGSFKPIIKHIGLFVTIAAFTFLAFNALLFIKYHSFPDFAGFLKYQKLFFGAGLGMLPMPLIHIWFLAVLIYMLGVIYSFNHLIKKNYCIKSSIVFFLSILGLGLFVYYQGRSHDLNLLHISYPAVIILAIYLDTIILNIKNNPKCLKVQTVFVYFILLFFINNSLNLFFMSPLILKRVNQNTIGLFKKQNDGVSENSKFINKYIKRNTSIFLISSNAGVYYLEAKKTCPIDLPGFNELLVVSDYKKLCDFLTQNKNTLIFVDSSFFVNNEAMNETYLNDLKNVLSENYQQVASSKAQMILFKKKIKKD